MPVEAGLRSVLVASFSTRTAASAPDRVNGLQLSASSASLSSLTESRESMFGAGYGEAGW